MTGSKVQKRMAADVLDVGRSRVWFDPEEQAEIVKVIMRGDIREFVGEDTICAKDTEGNSKGRARERAAKRSYGHRRGVGSRKGRSDARQNKEDVWVSRIRAQRRCLKELREDGTLDRSQYRMLYDKVSGGELDSVDRFEAYIQNNYQVKIQ